MPQPQFSPAYDAWIQALPEHEREYELALLRGELGDPVTVDPSQAYQHGGEVARDAFTGIRGERPEPLSRSEQVELAGLQERETRLQPIPMFAPGSLGTDMRHNPFGVDTRGFSTGLANFALSLVNRERNRRLAGDPRKMEKADQKRGRAAELLETLSQRPQTAVIHSGPVDAAMGAEIASLASEAERLDRAGQGVRGRAAELRGRVEAGQEYDQDMIDWLERVSPGLGERILKHEMDTDLVRRREDRDVRADRRDHDYRLERMDREYELKENLDRARAGLKSSPGSSAARGAVWSEVYTLAKTEVPEYTLLPGQIQNAQMMLRHHINNRPQFGRAGSPIFDSWEKTRKELEKDIEDLMGEFKGASRRVHNKLQELRYGDLVPVVREIEEEIIGSPSQFEPPTIDRSRGIPGLPSGVPQPIDTGIQWQ